MDATTLTPRRRPAARLVDHCNHIERRLALERLRNALLDADIVVDDARQEFESAIVRLRAVVRDRDALARRLLDAIDTGVAA